MQSSLLAPCAADVTNPAGEYNHRFPDDTTASHLVPAVCVRRCVRSTSLRTVRVLQSVPVPLAIPRPRVRSLRPPDPRANESHRRDEPRTHPPPTLEHLAAPPAS